MPDKASLHTGGHWPRCILYLFPCQPSRFIPCYSYKQSPRLLQASHPFLRHQMPPQKSPNSHEMLNWKEFHQNLIIFKDEMLKKKSWFQFNIYMDYPPMFFVQACLQLPVGFDGSEQYFWICNGSCAAFYLDDFISDFTEQRAYAIWNGIAFLARSNIFCHSSKSFYSDSRKHYFMPLEHISVLIYQAGQGTMLDHSWNQCGNYLAILLRHRHWQIRKGRLGICSG